MKKLAQKLSRSNEDESVGADESAGAEALSGAAQAFKDKMKEEFERSAQSALEYEPSDPSVWDTIPGAKFAPLGSDQPKASPFSLQVTGGSPGGPLQGFCADCMTVSQALSLLRAAQLDTSCVTGVRDHLVRALAATSCDHPWFMTDYSLRRRLRGRGLSVHGSRVELEQRYLQLDTGACQTNMGVTDDDRAACRLHADCLGVSCCALLGEGLVSVPVAVSVRANPCSASLNVTINGFVQTVSVAQPSTVDFPAFDPKSTPPNQCGTQVFATVTVDKVAEEEFDYALVDLDVRLCHPGTLQCIRTMPLLVQHQLQLAHESDEPGQYSCTDNATVSPFGADNMTLAVVRSLLLDHGGDPQCLTRTMLDLRLAMMDIVTGRLPNVLSPNPEDEFPAETFDLCISGVIEFPTFQVDIFSINQFFMVGPVPMTFRMGCGGALGMNLQLSFCFISMKITAILTPWAGMDVFGSLEVNLLIFQAGIRLDGRLLQTKFPLTGTLGFAKFPLAVGMRLDMEMIPLAFKLSAFAKAGIKIWGKKFQKTIFKAVLWQWSMDAIVKNIFDKQSKQTDTSAPKFSAPAYNPTSGGLVGAASQHCTAYQLKGRSPSNPAFFLGIAVEDDKSNITVTYSASQSPGGDDLIALQPLGGMSSVETLVLPEGDVHFTVYATNTEGDTAVATCTLDGYDLTPPAGRVNLEHTLTSNPGSQAGTVIVIEDNELDKTAWVGVGSMPGALAPDTIVPFRPFPLSARTRRGSVLQDSFTPPLPGMFSGPVLQEAELINTEELCAQRCLNTPECRSFDYTVQGLRCVLHDTIHASARDLHALGDYQHYELLKQGHGASFSLTALNLPHGLGYTNARVVDVTGYATMLFSPGFFVDLTPPEAPNIVQPARDQLDRWTQCPATPMHRCVDLTPVPNHRLIVDGPGSRCVFNGHERGVDGVATRAAVFVTANWEGFADPESGIHGYEWAVGSKVCEDDIWPFQDPHQHVAVSDDWTHEGLAYPLGDNETGLEAGTYFVSVRAYNKVVHGGGLVTSVCKSRPFAVDKTPPLFERIYGVHYSSDQVLTVRYEAEDPESGITQVELAVGTTKFNSDLLAWTVFPHDPADQRVSYPLVIPDGSAMYIRMQATNGVNYTTMRVLTSPTIVDHSPPVAAPVRDGEMLGVQQLYTNSTDKACANWDHFTDPHSGVVSYDITVWSGSAQLDESISRSPTLSHHCFEGLTLAHNAVYRTKVNATHGGVQQLWVTNQSQGILVDLTQPDTSTASVLDGDSGSDIAFSASASSVAAIFSGFKDPEVGGRAGGVGSARLWSMCVCVCEGGGGGGGGGFEKKKKAQKKKHTFFFL